MHSVLERSARESIPTRDPPLPPFVSLRWAWRWLHFWPQRSTPLRRRKPERPRWPWAAWESREGAIPFAANDPLRVIPCLMIGDAVGSALAFTLNTTCTVAWGGFIVLPAISNRIGWIISVLVGAAVTAILVNLVKKPAAEKRRTIPGTISISALSRLKGEHRL